MADYTSAQDAARRLLGNLNFINASSERSSASDVGSATSDTSGAAHQAYAKNIADQAAYAAQAKESAALQDQIAANYKIANDWSAKQTAANTSQLAALQAGQSTPAATPAKSASSAPAAAPARMTLRDYDKWMLELKNQQNLKSYGYGNVAFRDPSAQSWHDWNVQHAGEGKAGGHSVLPSFDTLSSMSYNVKGRPTAWGDDDAFQTQSFVDPATGRIVSSNRPESIGAQVSNYGVAYRPQTGNQREDWVTANMAKGIQPLNISQWQK